MSTPWTVDELVELLRRHGFTPCDIPACNCGSWHHRDGLAARWRELEEILEPANGELMRSAARRHVAAVADLRAALLEAADDLEAWGAYADEHYRTKWDLAGTLKRYRDLADPPA